MTVTISHSPAEGTLVYGTAKGDGTAEVLKAQRFRWFPSLKLWGIGQSRDKAAQTGRIEAAATALRAAGFEVEVDITAETRTFDEREDDKVARAEDRAERLAGYAENAAARSEAAHERADRISERFAGGQPILLGHHSQRGAERDMERVHNGTRRAFEEGAKAKRLAEASDTAARYEQHRKNIPTTIRRIATLEAELRGIDRNIAKATTDESRARAIEWHATSRARLVEDIAGWKAHVAQAEADGFKIWGPDDFTKGDWAKVRGTWRGPITRVNKKSVSVETGYSWTDTVPYDNITGKHTPADTTGRATE
jgi:hypothetical protein